jgi:Flp pilus assembly protein TadG
LTIPTKFTRLFSLLARFGRQRGAAVAITYALLAVPLIIATGGAIEFASAVAARATLNDAADAAALAAANQAKLLLSQSASNWSTSGVSTGQTYFAAELTSLRFVSPPTPTITITQSNSVITTTLTYSANVPTVLLKFAGISTIPLSNTVTVSAALPIYANIYIVIDNSESMGIGATANDQTLMYNAIGCTFACHYTDAYGQTDNVTAARASGATLRIDVVKSAVVAALNQLPSTSSQIQVAVYTLGNTLTNVYPLSSNISGAITAVNAIDVASTVGEGGTDTTASLSALNALLPTAGTGTTAASRSGVVIFATDAVQNSWQMAKWNTTETYVVSDPNFVFYTPDYTYNEGSPNPPLANPTLEGIDPSQCTPIKTKGYTLMTLDIQYIVPTLGLPADKVAMFNFISNSLLANIQTNMSSCASASSDAFSASSPAEITSAMNAIFNAALQKLRITK